MEGTGLFVLFIAVLIFIAFMVFLYYFPFQLWIKGRAAGVPLGIFSLVRMRIMGVSPSIIVDNLIVATKAGVHVTTDQLIAHYMAGGHIDVVIGSLIAAQRAQVTLDWGQAAAIDLAVDIQRHLLEMTKPGGNHVARQSAFAGGNNVFVVDGA